MTVKSNTYKDAIKKFYNNPDVNRLQNLIAKATEEDLQILKSQSPKFKEYLEKQPNPEKQPFLIWDFPETVIKDFIIAFLNHNLLKQKQL